MKDEQPNYFTSGFNKFFRRSIKPDPEKELNDDEAFYNIRKLPGESISSPVPVKKIEDSVTDLTEITDITTASSSAIANNTGIRITSTLTDSIKPERVMVGVCESSVYQDSVVNGNQVPYGSNTISTGHKIYSNYEYFSNQSSRNPGKSITFINHITNESGSSHTYHWILRWRYVGKITAF